MLIHKRRLRRKEITFYYILVKEIWKEKNKKKVL